MISPYGDKQAGAIEALYLDAMFNFDKTNFQGMVNQIYSSELQFNKPNSSDIESPG